MKKFLIFAAVVGVTAYVAKKLMGKSEEGEEANDDLENVKERFSKLGDTIKQKLSVAEDNLKNATEKTRDEAQKLVDKLKEKAKEVEKGTKRLGEIAMDNWDAAKQEFTDMADKYENELKTA